MVVYIYYLTPAENQLAAGHWAAPVRKTWGNWAKPKYAWERNLRNEILLYPFVYAVTEN